MNAEALRIVNGRVQTRTTVNGGGILIGSAYTPAPPPPSRDAECIQAALLEPRTAHQLSLINRIAGAVWRWC